MRKSEPGLSGSLKRGLLLLLLLSFGGIAVLVVAAGGAESLEAFRALSPAYILAGLVLVAADLFLGGFRNHIFIRKISPGTGYMLSFRANAANMFMGAVTPSQGLGGPAQIAVLKLGGIPLGAAVSVSVLNFIGTLLFFGAGVAVILVFLQGWIVSGTIRSILWACAGLFLAALLVLGMAIFKPSVMKKLFRLLLAVLKLVPWIDHRRIAGYEELFRKKVNEYHRWCLEFLFKRPGVVLLSVLFTGILYLNKFTISWLIARGLGLDVSFAAMLSALYLLTFISYFAPSPGAGGIAEVATGILLSPVVPGGFLPLFTLLNRMFILFIPAGVGFLTALGTMRDNVLLITGQNGEDSPGCPSED
jgi:uncharacterized protein (TIRG00374 family)